MLTYHNDVKIKEFYINRIEQHSKADEIIQGVYWENGKGCAVGCTIHGDEHCKYEDELGIPQILAILEDKIFENLPNELAKTWPKRFLSAIKVGIDLSKVWPKFAIFLLTDSTQCNSRHPQCSIVAKAFQDEINGKRIDWTTIRKSADAAYAAAVAAAAYDASAASAASAYASSASAASAYASSASAASAYASSASAASAASASASAAYAVSAVYAASAASAASDAAQQRAYISQSEKLIELLGECE